MEDLAPRITLDPKTRGGKPVIKGTRVPVSTVVAHLASGWDYDRVMREFGLERADILAALQYAATTLENEDIRAVP